MPRDGILLSPKHGLNPSIDKCFWCGREKGVVLFGGMKGGDPQAPPTVVMSVEPCNDCPIWAKTNDGCMMVEAFEDGRLTGRFCCVRDSALRRSITDQTLLKATLEKRMAFVEPAAYEQLFGDVDHAHHTERDGEAG